jgi:EpsI family protein
MRSSGTALLLAVCLILILQAAASRRLSIPEENVPLPELHKLPLQLDKWSAPGEETLDGEVLNFLQPDDYILRDYVDRDGGTPVNLFVAHFESLQRTAGPHSPRFCLPGAGWLLRSSSIASIQVPGRSQGVPVNQCVFEKSADRILVWYWYQNDRATWAAEFQVKLRLLPDLLRYRRSDASIIRLVTPLREVVPSTESATCLAFARSLYPSLVDRFGGTP